MMIVVSCRVLFFKQKTAYEMRMSDWSSDVCSSDLQTGPVRISLGDKPREASGLKFPHDIHLDPQGGAARMAIRLGHVGGSGGGYGSPLACKADRKSVVLGKSVSGRVDLGGRCFL